MSNSLRQSLVGFVFSLLCIHAQSSKKMDEATSAKLHPRAFRCLKKNTNYASNKKSYASVYYKQFGSYIFKAPFQPASCLCIFTIKNVQTVQANAKNIVTHFRSYCLIRRYKVNEGKQHLFLSLCSDIIMTNKKRDSKKRFLSVLVLNTSGIIFCPQI